MARHFLFLQGPHGPFFRQLARTLQNAGNRVSRVGFNAGDAVFWGRAPGYVPYAGRIEDWPDTLRSMLVNLDVTDIVLYGDTRPVHQAAVSIAKEMGLRIHVFEEGYLRPYWITYERDGSNGHSPLMDFTVAEIRNRLTQSQGDMIAPPAHWGDMRHHIFYGAVYHWFLMFANWRYPHFKTHRSQPIMKEASLYTKRLLLMPFFAMQRWWTTRKIKSGGYPYHMALLQLEHDASFQVHSPFADSTAFIKKVIAGFAEGAAAHHHLVFKAHPLETGKAQLRRIIKDSAIDEGIADRVHFVQGGKLAQLLDHTKSAVTVNSTAGQQVLWRGIPLKVFGTAVYAKPEFVSGQPIADFFAAPMRPEVNAYRDFRQFLLDTSQVPGGYYANRARRQVLRHMVDMMTAKAGPYDARQALYERMVRPLRVVN